MDVVVNFTIDAGPVTLYSPPVYIKRSKRVSRLLKNKGNIRPGNDLLTI